MNILNELSKRNNYQPDLSDPQESCERTYRQAIRKLDKNMTYYNSLDLSNLSQEEIYDICNEAAADLALCCELFLKAVYIYEHGLNGENIDTMWDNLSRPDVKDANGNKMYINEAGVISYIQIDDNGEIVLDQNGQPKIIDENGNSVEYGRKGKVIKKNGHDLEYLITSVISPESRTLLDIMITATLIEDAEKHKRVDIVDILTSKGALEETKKITDVQYKGWLAQHSQTFIESRYAGQTYHNIEVAFLYHLAIQCKALAQYVIEPSQKQQIGFTKQELEEIPKNEIIQKMTAKYKKLLSEGLIRLVINDKDKRKKLEAMFDTGIIGLFYQIRPHYFLAVIQQFNMEEIGFMCKVIANYYQKNKQSEIVSLISRLKPNEFVYICICLKQSTSYQINEKVFESLLAMSSVGKTSSDGYNIYNTDYKYQKYDYQIDKYLINNKEYKL